MLAVLCWLPCKWLLEKPMKGNIRNTLHTYRCVHGTIICIHLIHELFLVAYEVGYQLLLYIYKYIYNIYTDFILKYCTIKFSCNIENNRNIRCELLITIIMDCPIVQVDNSWNYPLCGHSNSNNTTPTFTCVHLYTSHIWKPSRTDFTQEKYS